MTFTRRNALLGFDEPRATWGIAWGDADGDGDPDLWISQHGGDPALLLNRLDEPLGRFETVTLSPRGDKHGAAWFDFDADGDLDLLQLRGGGRGGENPKPIEALGNQLFENLGNGADGVPVLVWRDDGDRESDSRGLYYSAGRGRTPTVLDVNRDGLLDVVVANSARDDGAFPSTVFIQRDNGTFDERGRLLGVDGNGVNLALPADFDGDGIADLLLRSEAGPNQLVLGRQGGGFRPSPAELPEGLRDRAHTAEDLIVADFNGDGTFDVWLVNTTGDALDSLFLNTGRGRFVDASAAAGLRAEGFLSRNGAAGDFDNDGDVDVYAVNAEYGARDPGRNLPNTLWENTGLVAATVDGRRVDVPLFVARQGAGYAPSADNGLGWSVAVAEVNGDGVLDLLVGNGADGERGGPGALTRGPYDLFLGDPNGNDWLMLELHGAGPDAGGSNVQGIGAVVRATAGGRTQVRMADNGVHDKTQNDPRLHFGLGDLGDGGRVALDILWPSGVHQRIEDVRPGQVLQVFEADAALR